MKRHHLIGLLLAACAWPAANACADMITYTIDPTRSSLTITGTYNSDPLQPQSDVPFSLTTSYSGTIAAQRIFGANTLQITGGTVEAEDSGATSPTQFGPADYGFGTPGSATEVVFNGAIVNFSFSILSEVITFSSGVGAAEVKASVTSGEIDYATHPQGGRLEGGGALAMEGEIAIDPTYVRIDQLGGIETLTIPLTTSVPVSLSATDGTAFPLDIYFSGNIVATSVVPEPTSGAMLGILSVVALFGRARCACTS